MGYRKTGVGGFIFAAAVATVLFVTNYATPLPMRADSRPSTTMVADATLVALAVPQFEDDLTVFLESVTRSQQGS